MPELATYIGLIAGLSGAAVAWSQYRRARTWRAGDLAASLLADLQKKEDLAFACHVLDWGVGPVIVPARYRPLLEAQATDKPRSPAQRGEVIALDPSLLALALKAHLSFDPEDKPAGLIYRYCFDALFAHLAEVHRLLEAGQVEIKDIKGFYYWLERIAVYEYPPCGMRGEDVFQPFLRHEPFGYLPVIALGRALGVQGWKPEAGSGAARHDSVRYGLHADLRGAGDLH